MDALDRPADDADLPGEVLRPSLPIRHLWASRVAIAITAVACGAAGAGVAAIVPTTHHVVVRLRIGVDQGDKPLRSASALAAQLSSLYQVQKMVGGPRAADLGTGPGQAPVGITSSVTPDGRTVEFTVTSRDVARAQHVAQAVAEHVTRADAKVLKALEDERRTEIAKLESLRHQMERSLGQPGRAAGVRSGPGAAGDGSTGAADPVAERWQALVNVIQTIAVLQARNLAPSVQPTRVVFGPEVAGRGRVVRAAMAGTLGLAAGLFGAVFLVLGAAALGRQT